ncbi:hypothetical protein CAI21_04870 [Alkalilimnicola ehrlichii]|uniref:hypothetical protein n=1 Tax=Alkalilimnicola ehrlichii TaxID=351052 RepID=UPI000E2F1D80|nr:hypothetical protein [Alkalilimnicola ehrlichii]RFA30412.1 hypothetical protein CAI21_04870 [Alkalilimnicola ehrlichii]
MADEMQDIQMDLDNLYQEEVFTDRRIGSIMRLTPVTAEGETDTGRDVLYVGQTQIMTPAGALPLSFEIEAKSLKEAIEGFPAAAQKSVDDTMERLKEMRREAASSLVIPEGGGGGFGGQGGMPGGGMPGGGKIQLR